MHFHPNHTAVSMSAVVLAVFGLFFLVIPPVGIALLVLAFVQQSRQTAAQKQRRAVARNELYLADARFQQQMRARKIQAFRSAR